MTIVTCDMCAKQMPDAVRGESPGKGVDYMTFMNRDICADCFDELVFTVTKITRQRDPFVLTENQEIVRQVIDQMCEKTAG